VIRALVDGSLGAAVAEEIGLLRFYGDAEHIEKVRAALRRAGEDGEDLPVRFSTPAPTPPSSFTEPGPLESLTTL
jgi:hypothetical protein